MKLFKRMTKFFDKQQEAITFAQAGEHETALDIIIEKREEQPLTKLLVMGKAASFSKELIDYALEMAERMSYEILALNAAPLSCETFKLFSHRNHICEEFKDLSEKNVVVFKEAAAEKGISFTHVVMFNDPEEALEIFNKENKNIAFVVSESVEDRAESRIEEGESLRQHLYVYSVV